MAEHSSNEQQNIGIGTRFETLHDLKRNKIHSSTQRFHIKQNMVLSLIVSEKDIDKGGHLTIIFHENINKKTKGREANSFIENLKKKVPVRVIRSDALGGQYGPLFNYRYDGLYEVRRVDSKDLPNDIKRYTIALIWQGGRTAPWQESPIPDPEIIDEGNTELQLEL